jgi:hypothetical protein
MTAVFKKLNYKDQDPLLVLFAPDAFDAELRAMSAEAAVHRTAQPETRYGFVLAFAPMKADLLKAATGVLLAIEDGAVVWFAYPKQASKRYTSDLNRDLCWETLKPLSLQPVRQIAIDDDWSALRFKPAG